MSDIEQQHQEARQWAQWLREAGYDVRAPKLLDAGCMVWQVCSRGTHFQGAPGLLNSPG